jgi:hypothetical protein
MELGVQVICHGLAPCRECGLPVAAPHSLLRRDLFHLSRCPHCQVLNPHPQEEQECVNTRRTAKLGMLVLAASMAAELLTPMATSW